MSNEQPDSKHAFKKDRYSRARGGNSRFLDVFCSACGEHVALYQKDGPGALLRMYLDRVFAPSALATLQYTCCSIRDVPNLECPKCHARIGIPMVYAPENRLAFRMVHGSFAKKISDGTYPRSD
ncbi:MAG: hypothetical protein WC802_01190 [Patescibacteria group bacterium]